MLTAIVFGLFLGCFCFAVQVVESLKIDTNKKAASQQVLQLTSMKAQLNNMGEQWHVLTLSPLYRTMGEDTRMCVLDRRYAGTA